MASRKRTTKLYTVDVDRTVRVSCKSQPITISYHHLFCLIYICVNHCNWPLPHFSKSCLRTVSSVNDLSSWLFVLKILRHSRKHGLGTRKLHFIIEQADNNHKATFLIEFKLIPPYNRYYKQSERGIISCLQNCLLGYDQSILGLCLYRYGRVVVKHSNSCNITGLDSSNSITLLRANYMCDYIFLLGLWCSSNIIMMSRQDKWTPIELPFALIRLFCVLLTVSKCILYSSVIYWLINILPKS